MNSQIDVLWIGLAALLLLDMALAAARASLLNSRLPHLLTLQEQNPEQVERTLHLVENLRLRVALRLMAILLHGLVAVLGWLLFTAYTGLAASFWLVVGVVFAALLLLLTLEFIVEGRILPEAESWAVRLTWLGRLVEFILRPFSVLLLPLLGSPDRVQRRYSPVTEEELKTWVEAGPAEGSLEQGERKMIYSIFQFGDTLCREIMVPRMDIFALEVDTSLLEAVQVLSDSGHSRVPVYDDTIDNIIGILYAKDLLRTWNDCPNNDVDLHKMLRPAYFVPEAKKVDDLLREMQSRRVHLAIVVDEYGGVAGLLTLEDIVEEIVGEIRDEYDQGEELLFQQFGPDEYLFLGRIDLDDFNDMTGTHLTREVADTLGGWIYGQIGGVALGGEQVRAEDWLLTVEQVSGRRIRKVRAHRIPNGQEENNDD